MMVQVCLENWGYRVEAVADGKQALKALQQSDSANIAILDWEMPELDGLEVCRRLKETESESAPYVILLTARDSNADILQGFDAGAEDYMTKPFNESELLARVRVAERLVRTQASLAESVIELKDALNQLETLERGVEICARCQSVFDPCDGRWRRLDEIAGDDEEQRFVVRDCPDCSG
ncbi:Response regulator receiver domain-containing protein [Desulforhopalus singaporensis]|uniref:Response regulator receiver domain-containing protein n=2 Tax=Desulforhopalus singaporensis TaxID=91360 RepID=A0A1H0SYQ6_9BACT|nr:Response regulator receiver domain-containing protein [Desulforhopalus singaporensis]